MASFYWCGAFLFLFLFSFLRQKAERELNNEEDTSTSRGGEGREAESLECVTLPRKRVGVIVVVVVVVRYPMWPHCGHYQLHKTICTLLNWIILLAIGITSLFLSTCQSWDAKALKCQGENCLSQYVVKFYLCIYIFIDFSFVIGCVCVKFKVYACTYIRPSSWY